MFFSKSVKNYVVFIVLLYLPLIIESSKEEIMSEKVLEIKNLCKSYGKRKIINDLNMTVFKGDVYGFLGANGIVK